MRLRHRFEFTFLLLLVVPFVAVTILQVDRTINVMVSELEQTGNLLIEQIFGQIKADLKSAPPDPLAALGADSSMSELLSSSSAFAPGVVYARLETLSGRTITGLGTSSAIAPPSFGALKREAASWWPWTPFAAVWGRRTYEMSRLVNLNGKPLGVIRVGLSTTLIDSEARRSVYYIGLVGAAGVLLALAAAMLPSRTSRSECSTTVSSSFINLRSRATSSIPGGSGPCPSAKRETSRRSGRWPGAISSAASCSSMPVAAAVSIARTSGWSLPSNNLSGLPSARPPAGNPSRS